MAEILCAGVTHHPGFIGFDEDLNLLLRLTLDSNKVPNRLKDQRNWPAGMRAEWGEDAGLSAARRHRAQIVEGFRRVRKRIEEFKPDFIVIWGDDQYEQFREECVPPFNVFMLDELECQPYLQKTAANPGAKNIWKEPIEKKFHFRGHRAGAGYLTKQLIDRDFDVSYSYRVRAGQELPHSFFNTMLYIDYDRTGFDFPIVPFHVNCYGSTVIRSKGGIAHLTEPGAASFDPPSPTARRCFDIGRETAMILRDSPWRVALVASSSWSHAFLTEKNGFIYPDLEADRRILERFREGEYQSLRELSLTDMENAGQQEVLNWMCLAGALAELKYEAEFLDYAESYIFNSNKCTAIFSDRQRPVAR
jgi:hypothetical protein